MFVGYILLGSATGFLAALFALIAGQSLIVIISAYFLSALLTIGGLIAACARKHAVKNRACLHAAGGLPEHVVKVQLFLTDISERAAINPRQSRISASIAQRPPWLRSPP